MGLLGKIFGGVTTGGMATAASAITNLIDDFVTTDEERALTERLKLKLLQEPHLAQAAINKIEAGHRTVFVAGWRPFIGWVSGFGLAYNFVLYPLLLWISVNFFPGIVPPALESDALMTLVLALLGLGGMRTIEKMNGTAR